MLLLVIQWDFLGGWLLVWFPCFVGLWRCLLFYIFPLGISPTYFLLLLICVRLILGLILRLIFPLYELVAPTNRFDNRWLLFLTNFITRLLDSVLIIITYFGWLLQIVLNHTYFFMGPIANHKDLSGLPIHNRIQLDRPPNFLFPVVIKFYKLYCKLVLKNLKLPRKVEWTFKHIGFDDRGVRIIIGGYLLDPKEEVEWVSGCCQTNICYIQCYWHW